jgi:hypothetical protein
LQIVSTAAARELYLPRRVHHTAMQGRFPHPMNVRYDGPYQTAGAIAALEKRVSDLEEQVAWLTSELGISKSVDLRAMIKHRWGLSPKESELVAALYNRRQRYTSRALMMDILYPEPIDQPNWKIIDVYVCKARHKKKMGPAAIISETSIGYRLSDHTIAEIDNMGEKYEPETT